MLSNPNMVIRETGAMYNGAIKGGERSLKYEFRKQIQYFIPPTFFSLISIHISLVTLFPNLVTHKAKKNWTSDSNGVKTEKMNEDKRN